MALPATVIGIFRKLHYNYITIVLDLLQSLPASGKIGLTNHRGSYLVDSARTGKDYDMKRKLLAWVLAGLLCLGLTPPAHAVVEELVGLRLDGVTAYCEEEHVYIVRENGLYGLCRTDGSVLLESNYAAIEPFSDGMAAVSLTGEWVDGGEAGEMRFQDGRFGYVDGDGLLLIPMQYQQAFPFSEGRAFVVDASGGLVMLDKNGETVASFPDAALRDGESVRFSDGRAVIPVESGEEEAYRTYLVIDSTGREVCTLTDAYVDFMGGYHDGCIAVAEDGEWTLDESGSWVFTAVPGTWGYRNDRGWLAVEFQFDEAAAFSGGLAAVMRQDENEKAGYGLVSAEGEMIVPAEYDGAVSFADGFGAVSLDGKWAYVDADGTLITEFSYDAVDCFREGMAFVRSGGQLLAIDEQGAALFAIDAVESLGFDGGVAVVRQEDGACGVCDVEGNLLVPCDYEDAYHWEGYLWLKRGEMWRVYRTEDVIEARLSAPESEASGVGMFLDVPADSWYAVPVSWAMDHDVVSGTGGGTFSPDRPCTTGEIISFLWRAMGRPEPAIKNPFTDVSANHYYYQAALWAYENGLVYGNAFNAAELCSRSRAVTYLWRLEGCPVEHAPVSFVDVNPSAGYAQSVIWAAEAGISGGSGGGTFSPDEICSRGQIVTFLYRYLVKE